MTDFTAYGRGLTRLALTATIALASLTGFAAAETKYRISVDTGANHIRNITLRVFMERLATATDNELVGELFEAGQLYTARDEPKAVAQGDIEMSVTTNSSIAAFVSNMNLLDLPLFSGRSPEQVNQLVDGELGAALATNIESKLGLVVPGRWFLLGFTNTFGAGRTMTSFADFKGARIRVFGGAAFIERYKALGAEGVAIPFADVPMALSQGTIDALLTTNETLRSAKLFETGVNSVFVDQVSVLYYVPLVNKAFWDGLSDDHQKAFKEAWESVIDDERIEALRRQDAAAEENAANGVVIYTPNPTELAEVNARMLALAPEIAAQLGVDAEIMALAQSEIAKLN